MIDTVIFLSLCFFTTGFLCLIGVISFLLNYYFKSKVYKFYFSYITSTALFIGCVFVIHGEIIHPGSPLFHFAAVIYEPLQVLIFLLYTFFIYHAMLPDSKKLVKYAQVLRLYAWISIVYIVYTLIFPSVSDTGLRSNLIQYSIVRLIIVAVSLLLYVQLIKNLSSVYFRYLFAGCTMLFLFALLALWDSTVNRQTSNLKGFQFICIGYILENLCFSAAFIFRIISEYREKQASIILHQKQLAFVQAESQSMTMQKIGTEIHDNVGQKLTLASLYSKQLRKAGSGQLNDKISTIEGIIDESLSDLRALSKSLTSSTFLNDSFPVLLRSEIARINDSKVCEVRLIDQAGEFELSSEKKQVLLRLLQEFMQNSLKHARCSEIKITMNVKDDILYLLAQDNGIGFDIQQVTIGVGLKNLTAKARELGGNIDIDSKRGFGTRMSLMLNLK